MRLFTLLLPLLLAAQTLALPERRLIRRIVQGIRISSDENNVVAGGTLQILWTSGEGDITIRLRQGESQNLQVVSTIATGVTGRSYTWAIPEDLPAGDDYAFEVIDATGNPNYSGQFAIRGATAGSGGGTGTGSGNGGGNDNSGSASSADSSASSDVASTSLASEPTNASELPASTTASEDSVATDGSTASAPGSGGAGSSPSQTSDSSPSGSASSTPGSGGGGGSSSNGAVIGGAVGGALGGIIIILCIVLFFLGRKLGWFGTAKRKHEQNDMPPELHGNSAAAGGGGGGSGGGGNPAFAAAASMPPAELPAAKHIYDPKELPVPPPPPAYVQREAVEMDAQPRVEHSDGISTVQSPILQQQQQQQQSSIEEMAAMPRTETSALSQGQGPLLAYNYQGSAAGNTVGKPQETVAGGGMRTETVAGTLGDFRTR